MLTGSAAADSDPPECGSEGDVTNGTITLEEASFVPECSTVDLATSSPATVTFENGEGVPHGVHNVVVHGNHDELKSNALDPQDQTDDRYQIKFEDNGDGTFDVWETNEFGNAGDEIQQLTGVSYNGFELHVHCTLHDSAHGIEMDGKIDAVEP